MPKKSEKVFEAYLGSVQAVVSSSKKIIKIDITMLAFSINKKILSFKIRAKLKLKTKPALKFMSWNIC